MALTLDPDIFKAYDVRGTYPEQIHEEAARAIGAAFVAYLKAKRIALELGPVEVRAVKDTERVHNVVVCTLCSCYPIALLGASPDWCRRSSTAPPARAPTSWTTACVRPTCCISPSPQMVSKAAFRSPRPTTRSSTTA